MSLFSAHKRRRARILQKMSAMRAAKERKRMERGPIDQEPRMVMVRYPNLSWAMRDDLSGEVVWMEFKSVRDTAKRAGIVAKFYQPYLNHEYRCSPDGQPTHEPRPSAMPVVVGG
jgi:hypothetical protein